MKFETIENGLIIDTIEKMGYIGGRYQSDAENGFVNLTNKCHGCIYDLVMTQTWYTPETMNRVEFDTQPVFWDVEVDQWVDDLGDA